MRKLAYFKEVHPNWETIQNLGSMEAHAAIRLLATSLLVDGLLSDDELDTMQEEWHKFPFVQEAGEDITLDGALDEANERVNTFRESPEELGEFLKDTCDHFSGDEVQLAVLRLVSIVLSVDGLTEAEIDFAYAVGHYMGLEPDITEDVVRSVWESHEIAERKAAGEDVKIPPIYGYERARNRSTGGYPNPFTSRPHGEA
ncbi:MAG: hypothetical protein ACQEVA_11785 [Myxococcota bacterium]